MILDIFFDVLLAAGPFTVFYGMGQNSCSGKLLFRGLSSSDNSATFIEDSFGLTISSAGGGGGVPIDLNEIVYGTGTGITSSFLKVDNTNYAITGAGIINTSLRSNFNSQKENNSIVVGGTNNKIQDLNSSNIINSVILGGLKNCVLSDISANVSNSVISGGTCNVIQCSIQNSVILGGSQSCISSILNKSESNNLIHSSTNAVLYISENSNIHSSCDVCMRCSCNSFISSSSNDIGQRTMQFQNSSSVISGRKSQILATGSNNSIIASYESQILGSGNTQSTILSTKGSCIQSTIDSNIISGTEHCIIANGLTKSSTVLSSNIIGGFQNQIYAGSPNKVGYANPLPVSAGKYSSDFTKSVITKSTIIGGYKNCILFCPPDKAIITFGEGVIADVDDLNSVIGGACNEINISRLSSIIGGNKNKIICEVTSAILGGYKNSIYAGLSIGKSDNNYIYSKRAQSGYNSIIGGRENRIYNIANIENNDNDFEFTGSSRTSIIGSDCGEITNSFTSTIIGSVKSKIQAKNFVTNLGFTISNSTIISGYDNRICNSLFQTSQETTIISGYSNCISSSLYSNLKAFTTISSALTRPQNSQASVIISSAGLDVNSPVEIKYSISSLVISSCNSCICKSINSVIIASTGSCIKQNVCNSVILASAGSFLTWSNTALVQNLVVSTNTFVATASTNQFIVNSATGSNGTITSGNITVRHGLITVI